MTIRWIDNFSMFTKQVTEFKIIDFCKSSDQKRQNSTDSKETMASFQTLDNYVFLPREGNKEYRYVAYDSNFCLKKVPAPFFNLEKNKKEKRGTNSCFFVALIDVILYRPMQ